MFLGETPELTSRDPPTRWEIFPDGRAAKTLYYGSIDTMPVREFATLDEARLGFTYSRPRGRFHLGERRSPFRLICAAPDRGRRTAGVVLVHTPETQTPFFFEQISKYDSGRGPRLLKADVARVGPAAEPPRTSASPRRHRVVRPRSSDDPGRGPRNIHAAHRGVAATRPRRRRHHVNTTPRRGGAATASPRAGRGVDPASRVALVWRVVVRNPKTGRLPLWVSHIHAKNYAPELGPRNFTERAHVDSFAVDTRHDLIHKCHGTTAR